MSLIKTSTELDVAKTIKMMVYGQAGMGKSTFALSAPKPLLLDFDGGVKRINVSHLDGVGIVPITKWEEVMQVMQEDLSNYDSIVVDTIGKMIDFIIEYVCGKKQPTIRDWGSINYQFKWFTSCLSMLNKNIIFVAHRDTRKEGDTTVFVPSLREKNYSSVVAELDLLGYLEMRSESGKQKRVITFNPTNRNEGKNTCYLPESMEIPTIIDDNGHTTAPNNFIASQVIATYQRVNKEKMDNHKVYQEKMDELELAVANITDEASATEFAVHINDYCLPGTSMTFKARDLFSNRLKEINLKYDKATNSYITISNNGQA